MPIISNSTLSTHVLGPGSDAGRTVTMLSDGQTLVTWYDGRTVAQLFDARGLKSGDPFELSADGISSIQAHPFGGYFVVFDNGSAQRFSASGGAIGPQITLPAGDIAIGPDGDYIVAWSRTDGAESDVVHQTFDQNGVPLSAPEQVNDSPLGGEHVSPSVEILDGGYVIAWLAHNETRIYGRRYDMAGEPVGEDFLIHNGFPRARSGVPISNLDVDRDENGGFVVSWQEGYFAQFSMTRAYDADGVALNTATYDVGAYDVIDFEIVEDVGFTLENRVFDQDGNHLFTMGQDDVLVDSGENGGFATSSTVVTERDGNGDPTQFEGSVRIYYAVPSGILTNGNDHAIGTSGNDVIHGLDGVDNIDGEGGDDILDGGLGRDFLDGGLGRDEVTYLSADTAAFVNLGTNVHSGSAAEDLYGRIEIFRLTRFDDGFVGGETADIVFGEAGGDLLSGMSGHDFLSGQAGADELNGGVGDDTLEGGSGADRLGGGGGYDEARYGAASAAVTIDLESGIHSGDAAGDSYASIEVFRLTSFADTFFGSGQADAARGDNGNDTLDGRSGADDLNGGAGWDRLFGDDGNDRLVADEGNDRLFGNLGEDRLLGQGGDDHLDGGLGDDVLEGGVGIDRLDGGGGWDEARYVTAGSAVTIDLAAGAHGGDAAGDAFVSIEQFRLSHLDDSFRGSGTSSTVHGAGGVDDISGGQAADLFGGGAGNDRLAGGSGADSLFGDGGWDRLFGDGGDDRLEGGFGRDRLFGGAGADLVSGGVGNDYCDGRSGSDILFGAEGWDRLDGGALDDALDGGAGNDRIFGGAGDDTVGGGAGSDRLVGGDGIDVFGFDAALATAGVDKLIDFAVSQDTIQLDRSVFSGIVSDGTLAESAFRLGPAAQDADDRIVYDQDLGRILYDADGAWGEDAVLIALVIPGTALTHLDFIAVS